MLKKIYCILFCTAALISTNAIAQVQQQQLIPGITLNYTFEPNQPLILSNSMFWTVKATCTVSTPDSKDELFAIAIKKQGSINGNKLAKGQSISIFVNSGDQIEVSADSGAQVELTNRGKSTLVASCTA